MIVFRSKDVQKFLDLLRKRREFVCSQVEDKVKEIVENVRRCGDKAVFEYTRIFDQFDLGRDDLKFSTDEIERSASLCKKEVCDALKLSIDRIWRFHEKQVPKDWFLEDGGIFGQLFRPIERVCIYVPGGKKVYPSSFIMAAVPAKIAGVKKIYVSHPRKNLDPYIAFLAKEFDIKEIYRIGGVQAIAAFSFGTGTIPKVDMIVGPGNIYVSCAKKLLFGYINIDLFAGPSEVVVIADKDADPSFVFSDIKAQAEHDENSFVCVITDSEPLAKAVKEIFEKDEDRNIKALFKNFYIVICKDLKEAISLSNEISPEHLELFVRDPFSLLCEVKNAGAVFLGDFSPVALGDYIAGPNHILPTSGMARFMSPLGVYNFFKRINIIYTEKNQFSYLGKAAKLIADIDDMKNHAESLRRRL